MEVLLLLVMGAINILCFLTGARVGQVTARGEKLELPSVNPMEAWRNRQDKKETQAEQDKIDTILQNIESYDGTGRGQKDVPGR